MNYIDTHVHLTMPDYHDVRSVLVRAKAVGVTKFIIPGINFDHCMKAQKLAASHKNVFFAVGTHPGENENADFSGLITDPKCVAVGEIGLDSKAGPVVDQQIRFQHFLDFAATHNKPLILHVRDLWDEIFTTLADYHELYDKAVVHCFTGTPYDTANMAKLGILMSVNAMLARSNMEETLEAVKAWPLEKMMLETDGPWLPFPGEPYPNEPATVAKICQFVADLKNISVDQVACTTTQTAKDFFGL